MPDELTAKLIVMDTGPLITLAAADSLDFLLYPGVPIWIPDAVLYEATHDAAALGAEAILDWAQARSESVRSISIETFFNFIQHRERDAAWREKDLGERAAIEAIHDAITWRRTNAPCSSPRTIGRSGASSSSRSSSTA